MNFLKLSLIFASAASSSVNAQLSSVTIEGETNYPEVITPTRLKQSLQDVPASVTTISREQLFQYGITRVADALRLVPGMQVTQTTGNVFKVNYHGTNGQDPRRLNILVDGISVYHPGLAVINWNELPVAIEDISRIEITRGPDSASYGPNSMTAIINIISIHPKDTETFAFLGGMGSQNQRRFHSRVSHDFGETNASLSISRESDSGYDRLAADPSGHDSSRTHRLHFNSDTRLSGTTNLLLNGSYVNAAMQVPFTSAFETFPDRKIEDSYLGAKLSSSISSTHQMQLQVSRSHNRTQQEWTACYPLAAYLPELFALYSVNPSYANAVAAGQLPSGGTATENQLALKAITAIRALGANAARPVCGQGNQNLSETRDDAELQSTYVFSEQLRGVFGLGARRNSANSETYLGGNKSTSLYRYFGHLEYKLSKRFTLNAGYYSESEEGSKRVASPRFGVNYHISNNQTVRASYSKGTRNPDLVERQGNISFTLRPHSPIAGITDPKFYQNAKGTDTLGHENNRAYELGYLLNIPSYGFTFDAKLFHEKLDSLISQGVTVSNFPVNNKNSVELRGFEFQSTFSLADQLTGFLNYSYLQNYNATTSIERTQYSRHSGSLGLSKRLGDELSVSGLYTASSGNGVGENRYNRYELIVNKNWSKHIFSRAKLSYLKPGLTTYQRTSTVGASYFDDHSQAYAEVGVRF